MKIRCDVGVMEVDGEEKENVLLGVKNFGKKLGIYRRGLVVLEIDGHDYLVEARDLHDAVYNAGMNTGTSG